MDKYLNTFQLVSEDGAISPVLTTTREYGRWMEANFDPAVCVVELYMRESRPNGGYAMEPHPGTKIGDWFSRRSFANEKLQSWYLLQGSDALQRLRQDGLADICDLAVVNGKRMLRCYTIDQIAMYLRSNLSSTINILSSTPYRISIRSGDVYRHKTPSSAPEQKKLF